VPLAKRLETSRQETIDRGMAAISMAL